MIPVFSKFTEIGPVTSDWSVIPQIFNEVCHLFLHPHWHSPQTSNHFSLDDDFIHTSIVTKNWFCVKDSFSLGQL